MALALSDSWTGIGSYLWKARRAEVPNQGDWVSVANMQVKGGQKNIGSPSKGCHGLYNSNQKSEKKSLRKSELQPVPSLNRYLLMHDYLAKWHSFAVDRSLSSVKG